MFGPFLSGNDLSTTDARRTGAVPWLRRALGLARRDATADARGGLSQGLLDAVPDPFFVLDAKDRMLSTNHAAETALGRPPGTLTGSGFAETVLAWRFREAHRARIRSLAEGGSAPASPDRVAVLRANGSELDVDLSLHPSADGSRLLFGLTLRDAEANRTSEAGTADNRQGTLQTIVDVIPDPIVAVDRTGRVLLRNPASARLRAGSAHGDGAAAGDSLSEDERREAEAVMRSGVAVLQKEEVGPSGRVHLATRVPVCNPTGAVVGLVSIAHDVTAQKAAEAQLRAGKQAAEAAAQANREFLATTSHEVRTLMSGVTGMTSLLLDTELNEEQRDFVATVRTSSDALLAVINDVLDFSKIEAGMLTVEREPYAVRQTIAEALSMVSQQAAAKGLRLIPEVDDAVAEVVSGDAARVRQVLVNLLSNAVKFTDDGDVRACVRPDDADPSALVFSVADTGSGIAPDRLDAVFERFEQADASTARTHGGSGLGLSICLRLVQMMGGEMTADSVPGVGSVFRFTLSGVVAAPGSSAPGSSVVFEEIESFAETAPHAEPDGLGEEPESAAEAEARHPAEAEPLAEIEVLDLAEIAPAAATAAHADGPPGAVVMSTDAILPSARVLIVEDDKVLQRITSLTLKRLGYRPDIVGNGLEAVEAVRNHSYDVVLMDVMMPVMDGLTATRHIRADGGAQPVIVALTANAMQEDRRRCLDAGCDEYLSKPVEPRHLAATIERAIHEKAVA